jgi:hypothetical protein
MSSPKRRIETDVSAGTESLKVELYANAGHTAGDEDV